MHRQHFLRSCLATCLGALGLPAGPADALPKRALDVSSWARAEREKFLRLERQRQVCKACKACMDAYAARAFPGSNDRIVHYLALLGRPET